MPDKPRYTILGSGRWAHILVEILNGIGRQAAMIGSIRRQPDESDISYRARLTDRLSGAGDIVWIAVPPGPHSVAMVEAALDAGRHIIVEKPWPADPSQSRFIETRAAMLGLRCAVHFQYLFLDAIQSLRATGNDGADMVFSGQFTIARASANGVPAGPNLGSHLVSLWRVAFPAAALGSLVVGYEQVNRRMMCLESEEATRMVDFTDNAEPIIQRFIKAFETGTPGLVGLSLAAEIGEIAACL